MKAIFPKFESSDKELNITYNYRCELFGRHLKETPAGCVVSEFLPDVPWAGIYNTISCAAMHHFREGRWMQDASVLEDYAKFWCTVGNPRLYSFPIADSILELSKVTGNDETAKELYPRLCEIHDEWDDHKTDSGLYRQKCDRDGMEYSISGDGLRPTINSYMYAEKIALAKISERVGNQEAKERYKTDAESLRALINGKLWNAELGIFGVVSDSGEMQNVKELVGYIPWIFGAADSGKDACFRYLLDPDCFLAPYGLRTADASHPEYMKPFKHECLWNGPIWPFATAQTLSAVISYLHSESNPVLSSNDFTELLLTYARSQRDTDGTPWLDENMHPDTGIWLAREILREWGRSDKDRGCHYNHSTFIDLVMTGIVGICPCESNKLVIRPLGTSLDAFTLRELNYHGHTVDIEWLKTKGLTVTLDGHREFFVDAKSEIKVEIDL